MTNAKAFLLGCIGSRLLLTYIAKTKIEHLKHLSILTFGISLGFVIIYVFGLRKTGLETAGKEIWWNDLRPVHSALYMTFAVLAYQGNKNAWIVLLIDTLIGLSAWIYKHHYEHIKFVIENL